MSGDNASTKRELGLLLPQVLYRGLYVRIAKRLRVDPSYVSRVARGERYSRQVETALRQEIHDIGKRLGGRQAVPSGRPAHRARAGRRLRFFVKRNRNWLRHEWLLQSQTDFNLRNIPLSPRKRASPVLLLVDEALKSARFSQKEMAIMPKKVAEAHGRTRRTQKYTITALAEEFNLIRRCIFLLAEKHFHHLDSHLLFHDLSQLDEALDLELQGSLRGFLGRA